MTAVLEPGQTFAGYRIESRLGKGGMAEVYLAFDPKLERRVALKILAEALAEDSRFRARFARESKIAASLGHPNVVPVFEAGEVEGVMYIAMQYVEGTDLKALLQAEAPLTAARALEIVGQVARALDAAHKLTLIHRDVKPANILIVPATDEDGADQVYLSDFGLTKQSGSESGITQTGEFMGTLSYVAPEQIQGGDVDGRVDVYSLACVLYECLAGKPPFQKENQAALIYAHVMEPPPPLSLARPDLGPRIDEVLKRAMAKSPDDRYQTPAALVVAAREALGFGAASQVASAPVAPAPVVDDAAAAPKTSRFRARKPAPAADASPTGEQASAAQPARVPRESVIRRIAKPVRAKPRLSLLVAGGLVVLLAAGGAFALWPRTPTPPSTSEPVQAGARGLVPSDDANGAVRVGELLYPAPAGGTATMPCGVTASDHYASCPLTEKLAQRLGERPMGNSDPLCRCDGGYTAVNSNASPNDTGATLHVMIDDSGGKRHIIDVTVLKTADGWVAGDTTCASGGEATSIFTNNPTDCAG